MAFTSDRKTTGSYYTPDALVQELIQSALIPVVDDRLSKAHGQAEQEQALLNIMVIDPACGSGHFLLAAARRLAVALAQVRAGDDQPSEDDRQLLPELVGPPDLSSPLKSRLGVELSELISRN